jgi:hypothetical protein
MYHRPLPAAVAFVLVAVALIADAGRCCPDALGSESWRYLSTPPCVDVRGATALKCTKGEEVFDSRTVLHWCIDFYVSGVVGGWREYAPPDKIRSAVFKV